MVNLTSLIDVLFLLLIFFMLSSTFRMAGEMDLQLPSSRTAGAAQDAPAETLARVSLRADGSLFLDGEAVSIDQLRAELGKRVAADSSTRVRLDAEGDARHAAVIELLDLVRELGFSGVGLGTELEHDATGAPR